MVGGVGNPFTPDNKKKLAARHYFKVGPYWGTTCLSSLLLLLFLSCLARLGSWPWADVVADESGISNYVAEGKDQPPSIFRRTVHFDQEIFRPGLANPFYLDLWILRAYAALRVFQERHVSDPLRRLYQYRLGSTNFGRSGSLRRSFLTGTSTHSSDCFEAFGLSFSCFLVADSRGLPASSHS